MLCPRLGIHDHYPPLRPPGDYPKTSWTHRGWPRGSNLPVVGTMYSFRRPLSFHPARRVVHTALRFMRHITFENTAYHSYKKRTLQHRSRFAIRMMLITIHDTGQLELLNVLCRRELVPPPSGSFMGYALRLFTLVLNAVFHVFRSLLAELVENRHQGFSCFHK